MIEDGLAQKIGGRFYMLKTDDLHRLEPIETYDITKESGPDLTDKNNKWNVYKAAAKKVATAWIGWDPDRVKKISNCAESVYAARYASGRREVRAQRCKDPLCPICSWRKGLKQAKLLSDRLKQLDMPVAHLVLTLRSVPDVTGSLDRLWGAWRSLNRRKWFKALVAGAFVSVEWTYRRGLWHPHLHVLTVLSGDYSDSYLDDVKRSKIEPIWNEITGDSFICFWKRRDIDSGVGQVIKYVTDAIVCESELPSEGLRALGAEIHGRRLVSTTGLLRGCLKGDCEEEEDEEVEELVDDYIVAFEEWRWNEEKGVYELVAEVLPGDLMFNVMMSGEKRRKILKCKNKKLA